MEEEITIPQEDVSTAMESFVVGAGDASNWVTAFATVTLAFLTLVLVIATFRMVSAMARPHVVANLESNQWSLIHMDLVVENSGNAPAYDVRVKFTPPIKLSDVKGDDPIPLSRIGLLRPGQTLVSFATEWAAVKDKTFKVEVEWKRHPNSRRSEVLSYDLNMRVLEGVSHLGKHNPMIQLAEQIKHIRDDWKTVAQGNRRTKVDVFDQNDRDEEKRLRDEHFAELRRESEEKSALDKG